MNKTKKYLINENCFNKLDEYSLYWLGFLYADGYARYDDIRLSIGEIDKSHVEKFSNFLETNKPLNYRSPEQAKGYGGERGTWGLQIKNVFIGTLLAAKYGFVQNRKSYVPSFLLELDRYQLSYWLRGFIDGDGCISNPFGTTKYPLYRIRFCTRKLLGEFITQRLYENGICHLLNINNYHTKSDIMQLAYSGKPQSMKLANYLYGNAKIYLDRKFDIVKEYYM